MNTSKLIRLYAACAAAAAAAAGCTMHKTPAPADESAFFAPVDYKNACILPNPSVPNTKVIQATAQGFARAGAVPKILSVGDGPLACEFVVTYSISASGRNITAIRYQTYEHGIPRISASGRAADGGLTVENTSAFAEDLMKKLIAKSEAVEADKQDL